MKTNITHSQIQFYQENGYVLVEDFLNANELQFWKTAKL